jgi:hypothetical protein
MRLVVLAAENSTNVGVLPMGGYSQAEVGYQAYLLIEAGLARGSSVQNTGHSGPSAYIRSLTMPGREYAELVRDENRWKMALAEAQRNGVVTLRVLRELLSHPPPSQERAADVAQKRQKDLMYIITNKALRFHLPGRKGGAEQSLQVGPGGLHLVPAWIRETPTFGPASRDGSLREVEISNSSPAAAQQSGFRPVADPVALSPGREYPRWIYHATEQARTVASREEEAQLGMEWSRVYIHQEYPKVKYHWSGKDKTVKSEEEEAVLGGGWANSPGAFDPYRPAGGPDRQSRPCEMAGGVVAPGLDIRPSQEDRGPIAQGGRYVRPITRS